MHFVENVRHFYSLLRNHQLILRSLRVLKIHRIKFWLYYNSAYGLIDLMPFLLQSPVEKEKKTLVQRAAPSIISNHKSLNILYYLY